MLQILLKSTFVGILSMSSLAPVLSGVELDLFKDTKSRDISTSTDLSAKKSDDKIGSTLFGSASSPIQAIKETTLGFTLVGTMPSNVSSYGMATVLINGKNEKLIRIGHSITPNVMLNEVHASHIVINRNGALEKLSFVIPQNLKNLDERRLSKKSVSLGQPSANAIGQNQEHEKPAQSTIKAKTTLAETLQRQVTSLALDKVASNLKSDPSKALSDIGVNQSPSGYSIAKNSLLLKVGLKAGDVIISVNGIAAESIVQNTNEINKIKSSGSANVVVLRGSKTKTLTFNF